MNYFVIEEKLANDILNYLGRQSWIEVNPFIQQLQRLKKIEMKKEDTKEDKK